METDDASGTLAHGATQKPSGFANARHGPRHRTFPSHRRFHLIKNRHHLLSIFLTVGRGVEIQKTTVDREHPLHLFPRHTHAGDSGKMFQAVHFLLQVTLPETCKTIGLLAT